MKKSKKVLALSLALTLAASALAGCGSDKGAAETTDSTQSATEAPAEGTDVAEGTEGTDDAADKNPVTLTTVSMNGGTEANAPIYQEINNKFMAQYPYITIEDDSQASTQEWKTKIAADFSIGNEPDVIQFFTDANASDVLTADKFMTVEEIQAEYPEYAGETEAAALDAAKNPDGVSRAVPTTGFWEGLFCNKDLFDKYSLELPTDWDSLVKAIETFKENDIIPISVSLNEVPHYWVEYLMLYAAGVESYTSIPETAPAEWAAGLDKIKELRDMGAFPVDTDTINNDMANTLFHDKKAAMQLDGSWFLKGIPDQENVAVVGFPVFEGSKAEAGTVLCGISSGYYITKKAWEDPDKRDAAVKFVMAHTSKEGVAQYWDGVSTPAVAMDAPADMTPLALSAMKYIGEAKKLVAPTDARMAKEAYNTLTGSIVSMTTGEKTSEEIINEALTINAR